MTHLRLQSSKLLICLHRKTKLELQLLKSRLISINYHNRCLTNRLALYRGTVVADATVYRTVASKTAIYRSYRYTVQRYQYLATGFPSRLSPAPQQRISPLTYVRDTLVVSVSSSSL